MKFVLLAKYKCSLLCFSQEPGAENVEARVRDRWDEMNEVKRLAGNWK